MNEERWICAAFESKDFKGNFLSLGNWSSVTDPLVDVGWSGVVVDHSPFEKLHISESGRVTYLHGVLQPDPHYVKVERNYFARSITLREVLDNFNGPFDAFIVNVPSFGRDILCSEGTWAAWPRVICVNAEGREQEITNQTADHGYQVLRIERGALLLARGLQVGDQASSRKG